jgi:hypothetical protein
MDPTYCVYLDPKSQYSLVRTQKVFHGSHNRSAFAVERFNRISALNKAAHVPEFK